MNDIVQINRDADGICTIALNRPPANAINYDVMAALKEAFLEASDDWEARVIILASTNDRFFCAGREVKESRPEASTLPRALPHYGMQLGREMFRAIYECKVPVIAKVNGLAIGSGFLFACLTDFVIASETAQFGQFEIKHNAVGGAGILRRMLSEQAMRYLTWTAETVSASEPLALGAGIRVVPHDLLDKEAKKIARSIAERPVEVIRHTKYSLGQSEFLDPVDAYDMEQLHTLAIATGQHLP